MTNDVTANGATLTTSTLAFRNAANKLLDGLPWQRPPVDLKIYANGQGFWDCWITADGLVWRAFSIAYRGGTPRRSDALWHAIRAQEPAIAATLSPTDLKKLTKLAGRLPHP